MSTGFGSLPSFASGDDQNQTLSPSIQAWLQDQALQQQYAPPAQAPGYTGFNASTTPTGPATPIANPNAPSLSSVANGVMNGATGAVHEAWNAGPGFTQKFLNGQIDPQSEEAAGGALGAAGYAMTGGLGGVPIKAGETALGSGPIRAYHGSPHDFDRFSMNAIGTGEGNQAFGHGLYFAGDEAVARSYRDALAPYGGGASTKDSAARYLQRYDGDADAARAALRDQMNSAYGRGDMNAVDGLRQIHGQLYTPPQKLIGRMYEVGIDADPKKLLDWDAPVASQPKVRDLAGDMGARLRSDATGGDAYAAIRDRSPIPGSDMGGLIEPDYGSSAVAAQALRDAGVPGLRYLDGNSRGLAGGSHNYVTFSDDIVSILRKYGLAGLLGGGSALGALNQKQGGSSL